MIRDFLARRHDIPKTLLIITIVMFWSKDIFSQTDSPQADLEFYSATIIVKDLKASAIWYRKFLKFKVKEYKANRQVKMQLDSFKLVLKQGVNTQLFSQIRLPKGKKYVHGFNKIGFATNQIDSLYGYYERYELNLHDGMAYDPNMKKNYFIVSDIDGNKIQIFDKKNGEKIIKIRPVFFSIISSDYLQTIKWYKEKLHFEDMKIVDESKIEFQNLLVRGSIILEVLHKPFESLEITEFMSVNRDLAGYDVLKFRIPNGKKSAFQMDNSGNKILMKK